MSGLIFIGIMVVIIGVIIAGIMFEMIHSVRERKWLKKMRDLDQANYIEGILSQSFALSSLFGLAKSLGIHFRIHPSSHGFSEKKNSYVWDANYKKKEIRVAVDLKTLRIIPVDLWAQRFVMAHEIGHAISPSTGFIPPCYQDGDSKLRFILEGVDLICLFHELCAEIEGKKILKQIFIVNENLPNVNSILEVKHQERLEELRKRAEGSICWKEITKEHCPKKDELSLFFQENHS